jgi:uncharacterized PurR-regulated membrane protein YhhQ (DUF165 family)
MDVGRDFGGRYARQPQDDGVFRRIGRGFGALLRLVVPVLLLATLGGASFAYAGMPAPVLTQPWMNLGLLLLPVTFLAVHLTSRRYGAAYAFAQIFLTYAAAIALAVFGQQYITMALGEQHAATREIVGFGAGLFVAHVVAIFLFDRLRGPQWWQAPLFASLIGGVVLCGVAFPATYFGTGVEWSGRMLDYMAVTSSAAVLLVIPYWMLRGLVPPRPGYGGY